LEKGGYVLEEEVVMIVGKKTSTLSIGDSFLFDGILPHDLQSPMDRVAKLLWIIAKLPNDSAPPPMVTCFTCHRGMPRPMGPDRPPPGRSP